MTTQDILKETDLIYCHDSNLSIHRKKVGKEFTYIDESDGVVTDKEVKNRVEQLRIPPAWHDVRISDCPDTHIQAVGVDDRGKKQYIYNSEWNRIQQENKFNKMIFFGEVLPELRQKIESDMRIKGLKRERVLATVVWLLENTFIRIGNQEYAKQNKSYGLTTLREKHVDVKGDFIRFDFKGKSGVFHSLGISHPRVARTIRKCIELPGYEIFQYVNEDGKRQLIESRDVNDYLKSITGEHFTAKDFRTWGGTVLAGFTLHELGTFTSKTGAKKNITQAVKKVTKHLRNTPATCRSYYIHPTIFDTYNKELLIPHYDDVYKRIHKKMKLNREEYASWTLLKEYSR